jgi:NADPH:quinone reductase-like Zn-dependent oxidoreductase
MKAIVFTRYGPPDVLELRDVAKPVPKDGEVLVRVHAASINDWDYGAMQGTDFVNRVLFGLLKPREGKQILGSDIAGTVEAVGRDVRRFQPGDEVFGDLSGTWGGFAEYVCAREKALALKSPGMSFEQAAAIPQPAMLAVQGLRYAVTIRPGQKVLINGGGGSSGVFAIQLAKLYGAEVTAIDSGAKLDLMRALGADHVFDYTCHDFTSGAARYDVILDVKTRRPVSECLRALDRGGTYVTLGGSMAGLLLSSWRKQVRLVVLKPNKDLEYVKELFEAGRLMPVIDGPYALDALPEAMRHFGAGRHRGKVVIAVGREVPGAGEPPEEGLEAQVRP